MISFTLAQLPLAPTPLVMTASSSTTPHANNTEAQSAKAPEPMILMPSGK